MESSYLQDGTIRWDIFFKWKGWDIFATILIRDGQKV